MNWWQRLWRRRQMEEQLEKELRFHLEKHLNDLITHGVDPQEARRLANLELGGSEQVKEQCREARGTRWLEDLVQDVRYALRTLRKNAGFTTVALLTLALGTGATTVMFTLVNGVLLRPLPFPDPAELVGIHGQSEGWNTKAFGEENLAYLDYLDCKREARSLQIAAALFNGGTLTQAGAPEYVDLREISYNLFSVLHLNVVKGRPFLPEEDRVGAGGVMVLGYSFWQRHFAGRSGVLGTSVLLDEKRYTIVGIAPPKFQLYGQEADVYTAIGQDTAGYLQNRAAHPVHVLARLRPDATLAEARAEIGLVGRHLAQQFKDTNGGRTLIVDQLRPDVGDVSSTLWLLLGAVTLVLLIACVNVASLLLARAVSRERELAMRATLGASRSRLIRQCLTESAVLGVAGGVLGIAFALIGIEPFIQFWPGSLPRAEEAHLDWRVMAFALGVSLLSGFLFGLAPALRAPAGDLERVLRSGARTVSGSSRRLHSVFVISEIALAVVLLVAAGMLGRALLRLSSLNPGLDIHNLLVTRMALSPAVLADPAHIPAAWDDVLDRARRVPGVQSVAAVDTVPMREGNNQIGYWPTANVPPQNKRPLALATSVTPDYFKVMGIALHQGRFFTDQDRLTAPPVIIVDDVLAQQAFGRENVVGKRLWMPDMACVQNKPGQETLPPYATECGDPFTVVGVVGHVRHWGLASDDQADVRAQFYYPFAQVPARYLRRWSELMSIVARTNVTPLSLLAPLREELHGASNDQVLYEVHTMEELASESLALQRFLLLLFGIFAGLALLLASIGIYGVLAYLTGQRVPEIGLRIALGASQGAVMRQVFGQSLGMICVGAAAGLAGAVVAGRILIHTVDGITHIEPLTVAMMIAVLMAAALLASFVPARRASRVDPMTALRQE